MTKNSFINAFVATGYIAAVSLFLKTVAVFACVTFLLFLSLLFVGRS